MCSSGLHSESVEQLLSGDTSHGSSWLIGRRVLPKKSMQPVKSAEDISNESSKKSVQKETEKSQVRDLNTDHERCQKASCSQLPLVWETRVRTSHCAARVGRTMKARASHKGCSVIPVLGDRSSEDCCGKHNRRPTPALVPPAKGAEALAFLSIGEMYGLRADEDYRGLHLGDVIPSSLRPHEHSLNFPGRPLHKTAGSLQDVRKFYDRLFEAVKALVDQTGLGTFFSHLRVAAPRSSPEVTAALVDRWSDTTHTFHMATGEFTITPVDFAALTRLSFTGTVIHFNCVFELSGRDRDMVRELVGVVRADGSLPANHLRDYWLGRVREVLEDADVRRFARAFLLFALTKVLFPRVNSEVFWALLPSLVDLAVVSTLDWARAGLAQMYYALDLCAHEQRKDLLCSPVLLQAWTYEHGFLPPPVRKDAASYPGFPRITSWMVSWTDVETSLEAARRRLLEFTQTQVSVFTSDFSLLCDKGFTDSRLYQDFSSPWGPTVEWSEAMTASARLVGCRFLMESPMALVWYFVERVIDCYDIPVIRLIPPHLPTCLFWTSSIPAEEHPDITGDGRWAERGGVPSPSSTSEDEVDE
ncbi:Unknown protein [Striga hermonthica]|uniref:Aminotransferase-like plant mobile domain-containing protein n=1 Tax=Striga hermonthica TaxID=68872 RepID=A0A9N7RGT0_STRHE|nr:Unknown protein [Striga hermonthica]